MATKKTEPHPLSNFEIEHALPQTWFKGVTMVNSPRVPATHGGWVINTDPMNGPGQHWVAVYASPTREANIYFDSTGGSPLPPIYAFMKKMNKPIDYSNGTLQGNTAITCGYWCIHILRQLEAKPQRTYADILLDFDPLGSTGRINWNESIIEQTNLRN